MAIILPKSVYFKITRCGSEWIRTCLYDACHVIAEVNGTTRSDEMTIPKSTPCFTFVRHPITWHQSLYQLHLKRIAEGNMTKGFMTFKNMIDYETFDTFINTLFSMPVSYYSNYVNDKLTVCKFVGHQENLCEDFINILKTIGEEFDEDKIRATKPINLSIKHECPSAQSLGMIMFRYGKMAKSLGYDIRQ